MNAASVAIRSSGGAFTSLMHVSRDRKSTRLNSSHGYISYAVFCLKKKKKKYSTKTLIVHITCRDILFSCHLCFYIFTPILYINFTPTCKRVHALCIYLHQH